MGHMPSPPDFLINQFKKAPEIVNTSETESANSESLAPPTFEPINPITYKLALEDRREAEAAYAEIYSQYLEVVTFNEKLLKTISRYDRFKDRLRPIYNRAKTGDKILADNSQIANQNLVATEKALGDLQLENEALRTSLSAHEEAFNQLTGQLTQVESAVNQSREQFGILADEYENRGILLAESDRKIKSYLGQIEYFETEKKNITDSYGKMRDENLIIHNQMRDAQLHEAAIAALNVELVNSMTKLQKQIHELEDKLAFEREYSKKNISQRDDEISRLRENRQAENLIAQSLNIQKIPATQTSANTNPQVAPKPLDRKQMDGFYDRWSQIIDELSTHSTRIRPASKRLETLTEQLISERGDLDII